MRKEPATNHAQAVVSEEPVAVVQSSKQEDNMKPAAAMETSYARSDGTNRDVDCSVPAEEKSSKDMDASNDENRDKAKSESNEEPKCDDRRNLGQQ